MNSKSFVIALLVFFFSWMNAYAVTGEILENDIAAGADVIVLRAEAELFESIRQGIMLKITECELNDICSLSVNRDELQQILNKLDARITSLAIRHTETGDDGLEEILLDYVDARDGYNKMLDKLAALPQVEQAQADEFADEDIFSDAVDDSSGKASEENNYNDLFQDIDEDL